MGTSCSLNDNTKLVVAATIACLYQMSWAHPSVLPTVAPLLVPGTYWGRTVRWAEVDTNSHRTPQIKQWLEPWPYSQKTTGSDHSSRRGLLCGYKSQCRTFLSGSIACTLVHGLGLKELSFSRSQRTSTNWYCSRSFHLLVSALYTTTDT